MTRYNETAMGRVAAGAVVGVMLAAGAMAQPKEILIGDQCDRTGPTQIVGTSCAQRCRIITS